MVTLYVVNMYIVIYLWMIATRRDSNLGRIEVMTDPSREVTQVIRVIGLNLDHNTTLFLLKVLYIN